MIMHASLASVSLVLVLSSEAQPVSTPVYTAHLYTVRVWDNVPFKQYSSTVSPAFQNDSQHNIDSGTLQVGPSLRSPQYRA